MNFEYGQSKSIELDDGEVFEYEQSKSIELDEGDVRTIVRLGKELGDIKSQLRRIYNDWNNLLTPMDWKDPKFERILLEYSDNIFSRLGRDGSQAVKSGAHNLLCHNVYHQGGSYTFEELMAFQNGYGILKGLLYQAFDESSMGKGDDSFSDFLDSFPLAGIGLCEDVIGGTYGAGEEMDLNAIKMEVRGVYQTWDTPCFANEEEWFQFIWEGENYISFNLYEMLMKRMSVFIRSIAPDNTEEMGWE